MHYLRDNKLLLITIVAGITALAWMLFRRYQAPDDVAGSDLLSGFASLLLPPLTIIGIVSLFKNLQSNLTQGITAAEPFSAMLA